MKLIKKTLRILALVMAIAMCASALGCLNSYRGDPIVAKVGDVKLDLNQYLTLYNNTDSNTNMYYMYMQYGLIDRAQYANYILDDLVNYGVQLNQAKVQGITLDETEEAELQTKVDDQIKDYLNSNYASKISSSITGEQEKYEAELELLKKELSDNGSSFEEYRKNIEESLRNSTLISKLHDVNVADVTVDNEDVKAYFTDNAKKDTKVSDFNTAFSNFLSGSSNIPPLFMPHPEKAVEDDPETTDVVETMPADPEAEFFSVQHVLMKFKTAPGESVTDLEAYAAEDEELVNKMKEFEDSLSGLTSEQFLEKCHDSETNDDSGMMQPAYQYFGYLMQKDLIDSYYEGFGYAAMKLKYGEDWEPKAEEPKEGEEAKEPETYKVEYFTLADGAKVAKVFTKTGGAHYIILNNNDCFSMYDENGYFMAPLYDGEQIVTDDEGIVTANGGHMTQEQVDAVNAIFANIKDPEPAEEPADDADDKADTEKDDEKTEEKEPVTLKSIYEACREAKLTAKQSEKFTELFNKWKEDTKIVTHKNLLKSLSQLG